MFMGEPGCMGEPGDLGMEEVCRPAKRGGMFPDIFKLDG